MRYQITHFGDGEQFEVEALTIERIVALRDAECADRNWSPKDTWAERVDEPAPSRSVERRLKLMKGEK